MRLHDDLRKCVVYLGDPAPNDETGLSLVRGTGFMVFHGKFAGSYLITAGHVAKEFEDRPFGIRLNDRSSLARVDRIDEAKWWYHPDSTVDVAVMQYEPPDWADVSPWIAKWFLTDFKRETKNIGAGDMVHIVGAYKFLLGTKRIMPIVHTGHIAMMADEEFIPINAWRTEGYLVEAQTLDTLSGSPVFVRRSIPAKMKIPKIDSKPLNIWVHGSLWMLGIWQGAWYGEPSEQIRVPLQNAKIPAGMGIVVPAKKIVELLDIPELVALRAEAKTAAESSLTPE